MKGKRLVNYLMITFLISWITWGILIILIHNGVTTYSSPLGFIIFAIGGFGPTIAAIAIQDNRTLKAMAEFIFKGNHRAVPYVLLFSFLLVVTICVSSRELYSNMTLYLFPAYWLAITVTGGGMEELGWRGVMQPTLEKSIPFPIAVLLTSITWSAWHLPLWFVDGSSQQAFSFVEFASFGLVLSFAMAAIHKKTKCVIYSCVYHGLSNTLMSYFAVGFNWIIVVGGTIIVVASLLTWYADRQKIVKCPEI